MNFLKLHLIIEFKEVSQDLNKEKIYKVNVSEFGQIKGSFSINDQEALTLNTMHRVLNSVSNKILELN